MFRRNRSTKSFAQRVDEAIARRKALPLASQLPNLVGRQSPGADLALESSEDWLIVDEEGLEDMLRRRGPGAGGLGESDLEDDSDEEDEDGGEGMEGVEGEGTGDMMEKKERRKTERVAKKLEGMAGKVEEFIHGRGAVEGAEFSECVPFVFSRALSSFLTLSLGAASNRTIRTTRTTKSFRRSVRKNAPPASRNSSLHSRCPNGAKTPRHPPPPNLPSSPHPLRRTRRSRLARRSSQATSTTARRRTNRVTKTCRSRGRRDSERMRARTRRP